MTNLLKIKIVYKLLRKNVIETKFVTCIVFCFYKNKKIIVSILRKKTNL